MVANNLRIHRIQYRLTSCNTANPAGAFEDLLDRVEMEITAYERRLS